MDCLFPGEFLPAFDSDINILRRQFHCVAVPACYFCGNDRGSAAAERLIDCLARTAVVFDWPLHALDGFLSAVTCFGLGIACDLTGLHTLKIKETDRLEALKAELTKLGADISVTDKRQDLCSIKYHEPVNKNTFKSNILQNYFKYLVLTNFTLF